MQKLILLIISSWIAFSLRPVQAQTPAPRNIIPFAKVSAETQRLYGLLKLAAENDPMPIRLSAQQRKLALDIFFHVAVKKEVRKLSEGKSPAATITWVSTKRHQGNTRLLGLIDQVLNGKRGDNNIVPLFPGQQVDAEKFSRWLEDKRFAVIDNVSNLLFDQIQRKSVDRVLATVRQAVDGQKHDLDLLIIDDSDNRLINSLAIESLKALDFVADGTHYLQASCEFELMTEQ